MMPPQAVADARAAGASTGASVLAAALALAVAGPETGYSYDPAAMGDYMVGGRIVPRDTPGAIPTSFGYTQLHTDAGGDGGGVGNGHSPAELMDGVTNFRIAMAEIQRRLDSGASAYEAIGPWSTRDVAMGLLDEAQEVLGGAATPPGISGEMAGADRRALILLGVGLLVALALVEG